MPETCDWCRKPLNGRFIESIPARDFDLLHGGFIGGETVGYYCSARCLTMRREELFDRRKLPDEKWPRFTAEIPPELAMMLDAVQRKSLGVNYSAASRAGMVRAGLRLYLNAISPIEEPPLEATVDEMPPELSQQTSSQ